MWCVICQVCGHWQANAHGMTIFLMWTDSWHDGRTENRKPSDLIRKIGQFVRKATVFGNMLWSGSLIMPNITDICGDFCGIFVQGLRDLWNYLWFNVALANLLDWLGNPKNTVCLLLAHIFSGFKFNLRRNNNYPNAGTSGRSTFNWGDESFGALSGLLWFPRNGVPKVL